MTSVVVPVVMIELLVVLTQEIGTVVTAVRGAHDGVDVMTAGSLVVDHHPGMVVELDQDHWAVHPVVEGRGPEASCIRDLWPRPFLVVDIPSRVYEHDGLASEEGPQTATCGDRCGGSARAYRLRLIEEWHR